MDHHGLNKRAILDRLLACPACRGELKGEGERYACMGCHRIFPVVSGIPRFLSDLSSEEQQVGQSFNFEHTKYLDSRYLHFTPQLIQQWLDDIKLPADYFKGKLVLDAGCGSGRWTWAMASLGATVVAVDLTDAGVEITHQATAQLDNAVVLQASVFGLPFRPESFDLVVSWGVLHHTPDTHAAFERIAPMVKRGGQLYVMVYQRQNPMKGVVTNLLRRWLRRLPEAERYEACRRLIIHNRWTYRLMTRLVICTPYPESGDPLDLSTLQFGLYDAYSPVFNHLHRREEVEGWFRACQFDQLMLTVNGERNVSINMRGVRT